MAVEITEEQQKIFEYLCNAGKPTDIPQISSATNVNEPMVMGTITFAEEQQWVKVEKITRQEFIPSAEVKETLELGLPEKRFLKVLQQHSSLPMKDVAQKTKEMGIKVNDVIKWGSLRGWVEKQGGDLQITELGKTISDLQHDEKLLKLALEKGSVFLDEVSADIDIDAAKAILSKRSEMGKMKERTVRFVEVTAKGREEFPKLKVKQAEKNQLTSEDITSGKWKEITLRPYDVTLKAEVKPLAKCHPLQKIIQETRRAFLEMGFEEAVSPHLELGFWDFDALFQPQDHPSRDMQDTFYMKLPKEGQLPDTALVNQVKETHEHGGETGSAGWGYKWDEKEARRMVLRTHTTATSVRYVAQNPNPPRKVFCVGRVFRNETISFKHLPEFHQVDGIIIDQNANFRSLLGTLQAFYKKMGFPKVKFKPAFFPYTEPSAEVFVWMEQKKCWIELGGSGVFRPEVTKPLGCEVPVLAWGLGLERLAMLRYGVTDIRVLYGSDLDWLQEVRLCQ